MANRILVDTSVFIDYFRCYDKSGTLYYLLSGQYELCASVITAFELGAGVRNERHQADYEGALSSVVILPLDVSCIKEALIIQNALRSINKTIGFPDTLIAATALAHEIPIATFNRKHFERVPNLTLLNIPAEQP